MPKLAATNIRTVGNTAIADFSPGRYLVFVPHVRYHSNPRKWYKLWRRSQYPEITGLEHLRLYVNNTLVIELDCQTQTIEMLAPGYRQRHLAQCWTAAQAYLEDYRGAFADVYAHDSVMADAPLLERLCNHRIKVAHGARTGTPAQRFIAFPGRIGGMYSV